MYKPRELNTRGVVTDRTITDLILAGWKTTVEPPQNGYNALWYDLRTGVGWAINQAAAILKQRTSPPQYRFTNSRGKNY
jgi:hypothetical protein